MDSMLKLREFILPFCLLGTVTETSTTHSSGYMNSQLFVHPEKLFFLRESKVRFSRIGSRVLTRSPCVRCKTEDETGVGL